MKYNCFIHNWFSDNYRCAVCEVLVARASNKKLAIKIQPIEGKEFTQPNNFKKQNTNEVKRHICNLPIERVRRLQEIANGYFNEMNDISSLTYEQSVIEELSGYILELTETN